jgi:hypothetical protein
LFKYAEKHDNCHSFGNVLLRACTRQKGIGKLPETDSKPKPAGIGKLSGAIAIWTFNDVGLAITRNQRRLKQTGNQLFHAGIEVNTRTDNYFSRYYPTGCRHAGKYLRIQPVQATEPKVKEMYMQMAITLNPGLSGGILRNTARKSS